MPSELTIRCRGLGKAFQLYAHRTDQVKQLLFGSFRRYYQEYWVLRDVDLDIARGESIGIIGRNGGGKTTLLRLLCGMTEPSRGELTVAGRVAPILALGAGFDAELTGRQNALVGGAVLGLRRAEIVRRMPSIAEFAAIGPFLDQPTRLYSTGMRARLAFAICAHADADVLMVDEALAVGDAAFTRKCIAFMEEFRQRGTLILVTHNMSQVKQMCDRAIWIDDGGIRASGDVDEVTRLYQQAVDAEADDGARFYFESETDRALEG
jgi:lipopolysaccharide transport system ATP-binding protein